MKKWLKFLFALALMAVGWFLYQTLPPAAPTWGNSFPNTPVYIIDAGHGGEDGGAISVTGTSESEINLAIALRLEQLLALCGRPTEMLRRTDISLHDDGCTTLREKKVSDLKNRAERVDAVADGILISIHQNSYTEPQYHGFQIFYAPTEGSQPIAERVRQTMVQSLDPDNGRELKPVADSVYLFHHIARPAVLVECGFVSNRDEAVRLEDACYQTQLALSICGGLCNDMNP